MNELDYTADTQLPRPHPIRLSDREALDRIAIFMGSREEWNGGDVCERVAQIIAETGRPPVGDQDDVVLADYRRHADLLNQQHDGGAPAIKPLAGPAIYLSIEYGHRGWYDAVRADGSRAFAFFSAEEAQTWVDRAAGDVVVATQSLEQQAGLANDVNRGVPGKDGRTFVVPCGEGKHLVDADVSDRNDDGTYTCHACQIAGTQKERD